MPAFIDELFYAEIDRFLIQETDDGRAQLPQETIQKIARETLTVEQRQELDVTQVIQEFGESGPLKEFLNDPNISEVIVNGLDSIWIEKNGILEKTGARFSSTYTLDRFIRRTLAKVGRKVDRRNPFVDARLPDGSRVCVIVEPAVLHGSHICIRKFLTNTSSLHGLKQVAFLSEKAAKFLECAVLKKKNILISGATGTGKTTLLKALASAVPTDERIITLEDVVELNFKHPHVIHLESRPANSEGEGLLTLRDLLRAALRMRPDRIILGECRGNESLDVLQALNTGHMGSMASIHANSTRDGLFRLEMLALLGAGNLQPSTVRSYIASAIQLLVHIERKDGKRWIQSIQEIQGMEGDVFLLRNVEM